ncbi:Fibronectin, type III domain and Immunoglobulin-like fold domain-containing protein [Strongyloides ratti]|uniref:protein-tyrosine-phosphatase n=1 Tax=Strongyloides ratti TaxID=34506 RepID=A0A090KSH9_STRRB|nr:Fibronectin, type III domain and Immunoglobulin-like fold domain-containing protein [Strongyloides ratti]CEF60470.1 Fibronectin, type III domain and Immunoglobulin-like fold domain-containing protein [Strongyloides ratti]
MNLNYYSTKYIYFILFLFNYNLFIKGSIFLDWASNIPDDLNVLHYQLDYTPNVGEPPPKTIFPIRFTNAIINNTIPAHEYKINLVAVLADGAHIPLINKYIPSSPYPPSYKNISTTNTEAVIEYQPPNGQTVTYYIEYFPSNNEELSNYVETQATIVRLKSLIPKTLYIIHIYSVYKGMPSDTYNEERFLTKGYQTIEKKEQAIPFSIRTLPPLFRPINTSPIINGITQSQTLSPTFFIQQAKEFFATSTTTQTPVTLKSFSFNNLNFKKQFFQLFNSSSPYEESTTQSTTPSSSSSSTLNYPDFTKPDYVKPMTNNWNFKIPTKNNDSISKIFFTTISSINSDTSTISSITRIIPTNHLTSSLPIIIPINNNKLEEINTVEKIKSNNKKLVKFNKVNNEMSNEIILTKEISQNNEIKDNKNDNEDMEEDIIFEDKNEFLLSSTSTIIPILTNDINTFKPIETSEINLEKIDDNLIVRWESPESTLCDIYITNLTYLTNSRESFIEETDTNEVKFKFPEVDKVLITVYCSYDGVIVDTWMGHRVSDFTRPLPVEHFKVTSISTDEFYLSSVTLSWNNNIKKGYDKYHDILVTYSYGKTGQNKKTITVNDGNSIVIEKLNPATLYTFTIKNVSSEFSGLSSKARGLRQLTPPVITSTLYPGQISSTSININFGESDNEHLYDSYELVFISPTKNITKSLKKNDEKSFTFNKLIPGKTYTFVLYTIYKGVKSRPVISKVTTYPLKVSKLYPVLGNGYASLYWDSENIAGNTIKYRLSYVTETKNGDPKSATVLLKDVNRHRFEDLEYDLYYTFTITVIMGEGDAEAESESETITVIIKQYTSNLPSLKRQGIRELNVAFENDRSFNTDTNGNVDNYAIIVTEVISEQEDEFDLKTWFDVKVEDKWTPYRASHSTYNPFKNGVKKANFIIGEEECDKRRLSEPYCNGVLKSNVDYYVKIRAYTERNVAIETEWVSVHGTVDEDAPKEATRRLPCHMYLNGCPRNHSSERYSVKVNIINIIIITIITLKYFIFVI